MERKPSHAELKGDDCIDDGDEGDDDGDEGDDDEDALHCWSPRWEGLLPWPSAPPLPFLHQGSP